MSSKAAQGAEARLKLAQQMLALAMEQRAPPETIAFWAEAVSDHEIELARHKPVEKPE